MKIGLIITTYNRPEYLKECLDSIRRSTAIQRDDVEILIVDDGSTNQETLELVNDADWASTIKKPNRGIKDSLLKGYTHFFNEYRNDIDLVINLDGDGIFRNDAIEVLLDLKKRFPDNIVSGFNTTVENRNPIIGEHEDCFLKKYASGINICINKEQYEKWVKPCLLKEGNWDYQSSLLSEKDGMSVVVAMPSVCQHIGLISAMGHTNNNVKPDISEDFKPLHLPMVTLFGIAYNDPEGLHRAAEISQQNIIFGDVVIVTEKLFEGRVGYSHFCMKELNKYITTSHCLKFEPDGYVQNWKAWDKDWLNYDLIGAPWLWYSDNQVGNGISLRSKRLYDILANDEKIIPTNDHIIKEHEEDHNICRIYRPYLEKEYGIKFAPVEAAKKFSIEAFGRPDKNYTGQFCFHGYGLPGLPFPPLPKVKPQIVI